jgi:hypothetical protein
LGPICGRISIGSPFPPKKTTNSSCRRGSIAAIMRCSLGERSAVLPPLPTVSVATVYGARKKGLNKSRRGAVSESRYLTTLTTSENFPHRGNLRPTGKRNNWSLAHLPPFPLT